jgi:hypothetical protein
MTELNQAILLEKQIQFCIFALILLKIYCYYINLHYDSKLISP